MQNLTFRELISPLDPGDFLARQFGIHPTHLPAEPGKFGDLFSWVDANRLLAMTGALGATGVEAFRDGQKVAFEQFRTAAGPATSATVDGDRLSSLMKTGAAVTLRDIGRLTPALSAMTDACQSRAGGETRISAVMGLPGSSKLPARFDIDDRFIAQIDGERGWRIFEGRYDNPIDAEGHRYEESSEAEHASRRGPVAEKFNLKAGSLLHIPNGQYYEASATAAGSLHLAIAVRRLTALDLLGLMCEPLSDMPLFRAQLPHIDDAPGSQAHLRSLVESMASLLEDASASQAVRAIQRTAAMRRLPASMALPQGRNLARLRVCTGPARIESTKEGANLCAGDARVTLAAPEAMIATWILARDVVDERALITEFKEMEANIIERTVQRLLDLKVVEPL